MPLFKSNFFVSDIHSNIQFFSMVGDFTWHCYIKKWVCYVNWALTCSYKGVFLSYAIFLPMFKHISCQGVQNHTFCPYKTGTSVTLRLENSMLCFANVTYLSSMLLCNPCTPKERLFSKRHSRVGNEKIK